MGAFPSKILMLLPIALMIPAVTVDSRLNGLPTATTHSPTFNSSELANDNVGKFSASIFINATSVLGSKPITFAVRSLLSCRVISIFSASATT